jgi:hypothetical protein
VSLSVPRKVDNHDLENAMHNSPVHIRICYILGIVHNVFLTLLVTSDGHTSLFTFSYPFKR